MFKVAGFFPFCRGENRGGAWDFMRVHKRGPSGTPDRKGGRPAPNIVRRLTFSSGGGRGRKKKKKKHHYGECIPALLSFWGPRARGEAVLSYISGVCFFFEKKKKKTKKGIFWGAGLRFCSGTEKAGDGKNIFNALGAWEVGARGLGDLKPDYFSKSVWGTHYYIFAFWLKKSFISGEGGFSRPLIPAAEMRGGKIPTFFYGQKKKKKKKKTKNLGRIG